MKYYTIVSKMNNEFANSQDYTILHDHQNLLRNSHYDLEESGNITDQDSHPTYMNATALNEDEVRSPLGDEYNVINRGNFKARVRDLTGRYSHLGQREKKRSTIIHGAYLLPMVLVLAGFLVLFFIVFVASTAVLYSRVSNLTIKTEKVETTCSEAIPSNTAELHDLLAGLNASLQSQILMRESHNDFEAVNIIIGSIGYMKILPAPSCRVIILLNPTSPSGYYWVRSSNGSSVLVYCDMTFSCSGRANVGWMRVAYTQINETVECPRGFIKDQNNENLCIPQEAKPSCTSIEYSINIMYSKICGAVQGQGFRGVDGFAAPSIRGIGPCGTRHEDINGPYLDGISITRGNTSRKHIWSFPAKSNCKCNSNVPEFVKTDYSCLQSYDDNNTPWFLRTLMQASSDSFEVRVCRDQERSNEDIGIESIQLYIQ